MHPDAAPGELAATYSIAIVAELRSLAEYNDERGNVVEYTGSLDPRVVVRISFTGRSNRLVVHPGARFSGLVVEFNCSNGYVEVGPSQGVPALNSTMRVGEDSRIIIGQNVSCTARVGLSAVEGTTLTIGDDVMFSTGNQVRTDDGHPIFDVHNLKRVNRSRDITIGSHVWLGWDSKILGGTTIGDGSVVAMGAIVKGVFPNNCIVAGVPARMVRRDIAWERPHLSMAEPFYKPDASSVERSAFWHPTVNPEAGPVPGRSALRDRARRIASGLRRRASRG